MRRGIVLHLLAGRKDILAGAFGRGAQAGFPDPAGERAVAGIEAQFRLQHLLEADPVAAHALESGREAREEPAPGTRALAPLGKNRRSQNAANRITRQLQEPTDLANARPC
jgi:hypothetical protein